VFAVSKKNQKKFHRKSEKEEKKKKKKEDLKGCKGVCCGSVIQIFMFIY
jgi:hypothetical protein